uniref:Uncharacterized protein n=1 Tax=Meloidogyne hapla TaxID=6305 RepID=A0A1I8BHB3_MELHA
MVFVLVWLSIYFSFIKSEKPIFGPTFEVGYGKHKVQYSQKVVLAANTNVAENINDVIDTQVDKYQNVDQPYSACIHDINKEYIMLEYDDDLSKKKGCSVDFITESDYIEFTVLQVLSDCAKRETCQIQSWESGTILPFAYGLSFEEFNRIKKYKGPLYGEDNAKCPNKDECIKSAKDGYKLKKPDCMPWTPLEFEWKCLSQELPSTLWASVFPIGAVESAARVGGQYSNLSKAVKVSVRINKDKSVDIGNLAMFENNSWILTQKTQLLPSKTSFDCVNSILEPKMWEITNVKNDEFRDKKLFTFYFLPKDITRRRHSEYGQISGKEGGSE